mmetsp:Transcript_9491/g.33620  ORF Transcript_9491/g.33620 Transcript_9491/m.33620 type:complete len:240 (+) Transcript_9491:489-1208(+)
MFASFTEAMFRRPRAISSAVCSNTSGLAASGRPTRTTLTPSLAKPSTTLSTAMLLSEAQSTPPPPSLREEAHIFRIRTATVVLPVPGGPCTNAKHLAAAWAIASFWLEFKPWSIELGGSVLDALNFAAARVCPKSTPKTSSLGRCCAARPHIFLRSLMQFPHLVGGAVLRCTAVSARANCCRFARPSTRKVRPDPVVPGGGFAIGLKIRGDATTTSHSVMWPPSMGRIATQSPAKRPRP